MFKRSHVCSALLCALVSVILALPGPLAAYAAPQSSPAARPAWQPKLPAQRVTVETFAFIVPSEWKTWTYDTGQSESQNKNNLVEMIEGINPNSVGEATTIANNNVPDMIAAAFAPETPGDGLVYVTLMAYDYQAVLPALGLTAAATPDQVLLALGFISVEDSNGLIASFYLDETPSDPTFTGGFALPEQNWLVMMIGGASAEGWAQYGDVIQNAIRSFTLADAAVAEQSGPRLPTVSNTTQSTQPTTAAVQPTPTLSPDLDLKPGRLNVSRLPVITPTDPYQITPYIYHYNSINGGHIFLANQPIEPHLATLEGSDYAPGLNGFVSSTPNFGFVLDPEPSSTLSVGFAGSLALGVDWDTVLLVYAPNGEWYFADDVTIDHQNPSVEIEPVLAGVYEVWIGGKWSGDFNGMLFINCN